MIADNMAKNSGEMFFRHSSSQQQKSSFDGLELLSNTMKINIGDSFFISFNMTEMFINSQM